MEKLTGDMVNVSGAANRLLSNTTVMTTTVEQAAQSAESVAVASDQMSATSRDIADNCQTAAQSAQKSAELAQFSSGVVNESVRIMARIASQVRDAAATIEQLGDQSNRIGEIISTIEDIADQTNLLALNAAIEAARAGEQGRGFAVVADEVRALAVRTTKATQEIGTMIKSIQQDTQLAVKTMEDGVREVQLGTGEAAKSGHALDHIIEQINEVTTQISQIATAAEEQTATTLEISGNIHQISETVQVSAQGSQEVSTASSRLSLLSSEMRSMVQRFQLSM